MAEKIKAFQKSKNMYFYFKFMKKKLFKVTILKLGKNRFLILNMMVVLNKITYKKIIFFNQNLNEILDD